MPHKDPEVRRIYTRNAMRRRRAAERAVFEKKREVRRAARFRHPRIDLAWAAGMFEGEGTVTVVSAGRKSKIGSRCLVSLTSTDREIVAFFDHRWPGVIYTKKPAKPQHKIAWTWTLNNSEAIANFLDDLRPFLQTAAEREKFDVVTPCALARRRGAKNPEYGKAMRAAHQTMRRLNMRGTGR